MLKALHLVTDTKLALQTQLLNTLKCSYILKNVVFIISSKGKGKITPVLN